MGKKSKSKSKDGANSVIKSKQGEIPFEMTETEYKELQEQVADLTLDEAQEEILECARYGDLDPVRALLERFGEDQIVDTVEPETRTTPLHKACANGHVTTVRLLLQNGAAFRQNASGNTPLHWAAANGHEAVVKLLLDHYDGIERGNLDVLQKNDFGRSALTEGFASKSTETAKLLLEHDSATEEKLLMGGKEVDDSAGEETPLTTAWKPKSNKQREQSVTHDFCFLKKKHTCKIRELPIAQSDEDNPLGNTAVEDTTGYGIWPASLVMAQWLTSIAPERFQNQRVIELGAGCGVPGIALARACPEMKELFLTDLNPTTVENLRHNVELNELQVSTTAATIDWDDKTTWPNTKVDIVIGCDLIYQKSIVPLLKQVVMGLLPVGGSFFYVAPDVGRDGLDLFIDTMKRDGMELVSSAKALDDFYANPLASEDDEECFLHFNELGSSTFILHEFRRVQ